MFIIFFNNSATSADFEVGNRELAAGIVNMSSSVIVNEQFDIVLEIIDNVTREKVEDIAWKVYKNVIIY